MLARHQTGRRFCQTVGDAHFLHFVAQLGLDFFSEGFVFVLDLLLFFLFRLVFQLAQIEIALGHGLQWLAVELGEAAKQPFVDAVGKQQHLDAFLAEDFQVRAMFRCGKAVGRDVVNLVLAFLHALDIGLERNHLLFVIKLRGGKAQQPGDFVLVGKILTRTFLQHAAELVPEFRILLRLVFRQIFQQPQQLLHRTGLDGIDILAVLQNLARDIQRQVGAVDDATHEAQILRHQLLGILHDEHTLHIQFDAVTALAVIKIERRLGRDIKQRDVFLLALDPVMAPG